ncbi:MAG: hypothetical protein KJ941_01965 [Bacteroidetes bacterium]|nr:hypothetical protein [Bacteroidota bacterium]
MEYNQPTKAPCPVCNSPVHGRIDKRFCTLQCKNKHHYYSGRVNKPMTTEVNRRLIRNLTILEGIMQFNGNYMQVHQISLEKHGFNFESITGVQLDRSKIIYECYHFTYTLTKDRMVHIRRIKKSEGNVPGFYERWRIEFPEDKKTSLDKERNSFKNRFTSG